MRRTLLGASLLVGLLLVLLVGSSASTASTTPELNYACALQSNGLLRAVSSLTQCKKGETAVTVKPGPTYLCAQADGSVRLSATPSCAKKTTLVTLPPPTGTRYFCATVGGQLRYVTTASCLSTETLYVSTPNPASDLAPDVSSTAPVGNAQGVATNAAIQVNFTEAVTAAQSAFALECPVGTPRAFTLAGSGTASLTLTPQAALPEGTSCQVTVTGSGVSDVDTDDPPDLMAANYSFSFQTADLAPTVTATTPASGASSIARNVAISVSFSEPVTVTASSFSLACDSAAQSFALSGSGSSYTLTPDQPLPGSASCTLTVLAAGVSDVDAVDPPDQMTTSYQTAFTTAPADLAPNISSSEPREGAVSIATNAAVEISFTEAVTAAAGAFSLECPVGTPQAFTLSGSGTASLTLTPQAALPEGTSCQVTVTGSGVSDVDTNDPPDQMAADYQLSFTTDAAPTVDSTSPTDNEPNIATGATISLTFSEQVIAEASAFLLECPSGTAQSFSLSGSGSETLTLTPTAALPGGTICTVSMTASGVSDRDGGDPPDNPAANYSFSFQTSDQAPTVTATTPASGANSIARNAAVSVSFSEPVTVSVSSFSLACNNVAQSFALSGTSSSYTLTPNQPLPGSTSCTLTVLATGVSDVDAVDPPDQMATSYQTAFTTAPALAVSSTSPVAGATGVATSSNVTITFNRPINRASVSSSTTLIECPLGAAQSYIVGGAVFLGSNTLVLDPTANLPQATTCTVTLSGSIEDTDGTTLGSDYVFSFQTADQAPFVISYSPASGATSVARDANVFFGFSEPVTATASSFRFECPSGTAVPFTLSGSGTSSLTLDPSIDLARGVNCTVTAIATSISDVDAVDPPDNPPANTAFSFTVVANQAPSAVALSNSSVAENQPAGTTVGTLSATDADDNSFTYTLVAGTGSTDNISFQLSGAALQTAAFFDYETKSSYAIRVRASDPSGAYKEQSFTITVTNVNEAPVDIALSRSSVAENQPAGTTVGALSTIDPDSGQTFSYSLPASGCGGSFPDNTAFQTAGSALQTAAVLDYETKASYAICVRTSDGLSSLDEQFTITVENGNDPPTTGNDSYSGAIGNTKAVVATTAPGPSVSLSATGLLANDSDPEGVSLSAVAETVATTGGGTVTINTNGSFVYLPGVGDKNQSDTFTYRVSDGGTTSSGTATVQIGSSLVWYVDNASATPGDGRSHAPLQGLTSLNGAGGSGDIDVPDDYIFLYTGNAPYGGGLALEQGQSLYGARMGLTVSGNSLVAAGPTAPVLTNAAGVALGLASGVDVQGLDVASAAGDCVNGSAVTAAVVGTSSAVSISGCGGDGVDLSGGTGNITIGASVTGAAGHSVSVSGRGGGTVTFNGDVSDTGTGILLASNSGANIDFYGRVTASTGTNNAFSATGGGTVTVTLPSTNNTQNTLQTTTGTALLVAGPTVISSTGLNFKSISSNGAVNGIKIDGAGGTGNVFVSGDLLTTGTGGTIENSTGYGVSAGNTSVYVNLWCMVIKDGKSTGVYATGLGQLGLAKSHILYNGDAAGEVGVESSSVQSTVIYQSIIRGSAGTNARVNLVGSSPQLSVTDSNFSSSTGLGGSNLDGHGLEVLLGANSNSTVNISSSSFQGNYREQLRVASSTSATGTGTHSVTISSNTVTGNGLRAGGIRLEPGANPSTLNFTVSGNNVQSAADRSINLYPGSSAFQARGTITNNLIGTPGTANSGGYGSGITVFGGSNSASLLTVAITNNNIRQAGGGGFFGIEASGNQAGPANFTITGNTVSNPNASSHSGLWVASGTQSYDSATVCAHVANNAITGSSILSTDFRLFQGGTSTLRLPGYTGGPFDNAAAVSYIKALNGGTPTGQATSTVGGGGFVGGPSCPTP